jgi:hypothetical protein
VHEVRAARPSAYPTELTHTRSGFDRDDEWGFRAIEPSRCCISSIALVLLKTGIAHPADGPVSVDYAQMTTAQKLLLFWRKPAVRVLHQFFHDWVGR